MCVSLWANRRLNTGSFPFSCSVQWGPMATLDDGRAESQTGKKKKVSVSHFSWCQRKSGDSTGEQRVLCREAESVEWGYLHLACLQQRAGSDRRTAGQDPLPDLGTLDQNAQSPRSGALQLQVTNKKYHAHRTKESSSHQVVLSEQQIFTSFGAFPLSCGHFHCYLSCKKGTFFFR